MVERRRALTDIEKKLRLLEPSWADFFVLATRRVPSGIKDDFFDTMHRLLEFNQQQFKSGNRVAIFTALIRCVSANVPLPYWLREEILSISKKVNQKPNDLHKLFGLESVLPAKGKRAVKKRQDMQRQGELWRAVRALMLKSKSKEAAISEARKDLKFPYLQRKSRAMFDEFESLQSGYFAALKGTKKNRMT